MSSEGAFEVAIIISGIGGIFLVRIIMDLIQIAKEHDRLFEEGKDQE